MEIELMLIGKLISQTIPLRLFNGYTWWMILLIEMGEANTQELFLALCLRDLRRRFYFRLLIS